MPAENPLIPDPDQLRQRLAELAREQRTLRQVLRAVVRGQASPPSAPLSLTPPAAPRQKEGARGQ
jgi:hypothetical protein